MKKVIKKRYWLILTLILISIIGFLVLNIYIEEISEEFLRNNSYVFAILGIIFITTYYHFCYLLALLFFSIIGFFISKKVKNTETKVAFKYLSCIYVVLLVTFSFYFEVDIF